MTMRRCIIPSLLAAALVLSTSGCGETPTSPDVLLKKGPPPAGKVTLANLNLASTLFTIDGAGVPYTVDIVNTGGKLTTIALQAEILQGSAAKGAGGLMVNCRPELGLLPHGTCTVSFQAGAYSTAGGVGTLVPGAATLLLYVVGLDGIQLASMQVAITLQ